MNTSLTLNFILIKFLIDLKVLIKYYFRNLTFSSVKIE